jgi:hypothetical protein
MVLMYRCYLKVLVIYLTLKLVFPLFRIHCNSALHLGPNLQTLRWFYLARLAVTVYSSVVKLGPEPEP